MRTKLFGTILLFGLLAAGACAKDPEVASALFDILENQRITEGKAALTLMPSGSAPLAKLFASASATDGAVPQLMAPQARS